MGIAVGQQVIIECRFTRERTAADAPGTPKRVPVNAAPIEAWVQAPDGTETDVSAAVVHSNDPESGDADGYYMGKVVASSPGRWHFRMGGPIAGGAGTAFDEGSFFVETSFVDALQ